MFYQMTNYGFSHNATSFCNDNTFSHSHIASLDITPVLAQVIDSNQEEIRLCEVPGIALTDIIL